MATTKLSIPTSNGGRYLSPSTMSLSTIYCYVGDDVETDGLCSANIISDGISGKEKYRFPNGNFTVYILRNNIDCSLISSATCYLYYWNGSSWVYVNSTTPSNSYGYVYVRWDMIGWYDIKLKFVWSECTKEFKVGCPDCPCPIITTTSRSIDRPVIDESISFYVDAKAGDGRTITSWLWNFGDGSTSSTQLSSHAYTSANTYTVTITVTNDCGESDSASFDITVLVSDTRVLPGVWFTKNKSTSPKSITMYAVIYQTRDTNNNVYEDYIDVYGLKRDKDNVYVCYMWSEFDNLNYCNSLSRSIYCKYAFSKLYSYMATNYSWTDSDLDGFGIGCINVDKCNSTSGCISCASKSAASGSGMRGWTYNYGSTVPDEITNISTPIINDTQVAIQFDAPTNVTTYVIQYELWQGVSKIDTGFLHNGFVAGIGDRYLFMNLSSGTTYTMKMRPVSVSLITRSTWNEVTFTTTGGCIPLSCTLTVT